MPPTWFQLSYSNWIPRTQHGQNRLKNMFSFTYKKIVQDRHKPVGADLCPTFDRPGLLGQRGSVIQRFSTTDAD